MLRGGIRRGIESEPPIGGHRQTARVGRREGDSCPEAHLAGLEQDDDDAGRTPSAPESRRHREDSPPPPQVADRPSLSHSVLQVRQVEGGPARIKRPNVVHFGARLLSSTTYNAIRPCRAPAGAPAPTAAGRGAPVIAGHGVSALRRLRAARRRRPTLSFPGRAPLLPPPPPAGRSGPRCLQGAEAHAHRHHVIIGHVVIPRNCASNSRSTPRGPCQ